jgi:hypothetical protein
VFLGGVCIYKIILKLGGAWLWGDAAVWLRL